MNSEFYIGGKKYISAKRASKLTGYASDYIGQLARAGKLDAQIIGRSWFVAEDSLLGYKQTVIEDEFSAFRARRKGRPKVSQKASKIAPIPALPKKTEVVEIPRVPETAKLPAAFSKVVEKTPKAKKIAYPARPALVRVPHEVKILVGRKKEAIRSRGRKAKSSFASSVQKDATARKVPITTITDIAEPLKRAIVPVAVKAPMYVKPDIVRAVGNFLLSSTVTFALLAIIASSNFLYMASEAGMRSVGESISRVSKEVAEKLEKGPVYLNAGLAAAFDSVQSRRMAHDGIQNGMEDNSVDSSNGRFAFVRVLRSVMARFNSGAIAFYETVNSLFGVTPPPLVNTDTLATYTSSSGSETRGGIVVVPSTGNSALDDEIERHIQSSFSDEVMIEEEDERTGVIKPVFKSGKEDEYIYVLVPVTEGG